MKKTLVLALLVIVGAGLSPESLAAGPLVEAARFTDLGINAIAELICLPAIFAYEDQRNRPARVGRITNIRSRQGEIRFSFELDDTILPLTPNLFSNYAWDFDIKPWRRWRCLPPKRKRPRTPHRRAIPLLPPIL